MQHVSLVALLSRQIHSGAAREGSGRYRGEVYFNLARDGSASTGRGRQLCATDRASFDLLCM